MIFVQVAFITDWFVGKNLNFALGIVNSLPLTGEILNAYLSPLLYNDHKDHSKCLTPKCFIGYGFVFYMGMIMVCVCFLLVFLITVIDSKAQN